MRIAPRAKEWSFLPESYRPHTEAISAGSCLDRVFRSPNESAVPEASNSLPQPVSFLAHSSRESAFHDRVFAQNVHAGQHPHIAQPEMEGLSYCELRLCKDVTIATLHGPDRRRLARLAAEADSVVDPEQLPALLYWHCPDVHGVMWTSQTCDPDITVAMFPARLPPGALELVAPPRLVLEDSELRLELRQFALRAGIDIRI